MSKISAIFLILAAIQYAAPVFSRAQTIENKSVSEEKIAEMMNTIKIQQAELITKQAEINYLNSTSKSKENSDLPVIAGIMQESPAAIIWIAVTLIAGAVSIFTLKTRRKPELCRCALRRELMLKNREAVKIPGIA